MSKLYGYYSDEQRQICGHTAIWRTPDGQEIEVTEVCNSPTVTRPFADWQFVGEVTTWVRTGWKNPDDKWHRQRKEQT